MTIFILLIVAAANGLIVPLPCWVLVSMYMLLQAFVALAKIALKRNGGKE